MSADGLICLIGLPGSGKSTVGRQLSKRLGLNFFDTDHEIEKRLNCSIRAYFASHGEAKFRALESDVVEELTQHLGVVLATGGGVVLSKKNRTVLSQRGKVVYLHCKPEDIFKRLRHDQARPLLQVADPLVRLNDLYLQRDPFYREISHIVVDTGKPTVSSLVKEIMIKLDICHLTSRPI